MSKRDCGLFTETIGAKINNGIIPELFEEGHVTYESIAAHREEFMGKNIEQLSKLLKVNGYQFNIRGSIHENSKAQVMVITNSSKNRNIKQLQLSPGTPRHGNILCLQKKYLKLLIAMR